MCVYVCVCACVFVYTCVCVLRERVCVCVRMMCMTHVYVKKSYPCRLIDASVKLLLRTHLLMSQVVDFRIRKWAPVHLCCLPPYRQPNEEGNK